MKNRYRIVLTFAGLGVVCVAASLVLYGVLHVLPPSAELDWSRRTISQYALLSNGWAFDAATLLLAGGSLAILVALRRAGLVRRGAAVALVLWAAGLVGVVWFEKHNWSAGPSLSGDIHRVASLVAFLSLPAGALLAAAPWLRGADTLLPARLVAVGGALSLLCFAPILWALMSEPWTGVPWWQAIPLGGVERLLGLAEIMTVLVLAWWAVRAARTTHASDYDSQRDRDGMPGDANLTSRAGAGWDDGENPSITITAHGARGTADQPELVELLPADLPGRAKQSRYRRQ
jgi:hypothetical protein